jgi:ribosomal protein S27E
MTPDRCPKDDPLKRMELSTFEVRCPECEENVEFMADDRQRKCSACGHVIPNPRVSPAGEKRS